MQPRHARHDLVAPGDRLADGAAKEDLQRRAVHDGFSRPDLRPQNLLGLNVGGLNAISGAKTDRPELAKLLRALEPGDVLIVTRLDRLARSSRDLLSVLDAVAKYGAAFRSLKDAWAHSTAPHGRLMLTVLGGLAEFERELIRTRTGEGRSRAQARGVRFGRPPKLTVHQRQEAFQRLANGGTHADIARTYAVHPATIGRMLGTAGSPFGSASVAQHR